MSTTSTTSTTRRTSRGVGRTAAPSAAGGAPRFTYDLEADVLGIWLAPDDGTAVTRELTADVHADVDASGRLVAIEVLDASRYYARAALEGLASPAQYLTLAEAAAESGLAAATLRSQISKGRLAAVKRGRDWLVSTAALFTYLDSRDARGRPAAHARPRQVASRATAR